MTAKPNAGQTPISDDYKDDLLLEVSTQEELNYFEALNINEALQYYTHERIQRIDLANLATLLGLHKRMFINVWKWAGKMRTRLTNLGAAPEQIREQLKQAVDDYRYWLENKTYPVDETAIRYHYRLVTIHPFTNGNGRFARLVADFVVQQNNKGPFGWGKTDLVKIGEARKTYLNALQQADNGNFRPLLEFAKQP